MTIKSRLKLNEEYKFEEKDFLNYEGAKIKYDPQTDFVQQLNYDQWVARYVKAYETNNVPYLASLVSDKW